MQAKLFKIGLILLLFICTTGCTETVYLSTNNGIESIKVLSIFGTINQILVIILDVSLMLIFAISWIYAEKNKDNAEKRESYHRALWIAVYSFCAIFVTSICYSYLIESSTLTRFQFLGNPELVNASKKYQEMLQLGLNNQEYQQRQQLGENGYDLKVQIDKAKQNIVSLKKDRDQKVLPLKQNYSQMYEQYYPQLAQQLPKTGIRSHEELLKNCEQYLELCSSINRVAKLQYYIGKLDDKLKQIGANIIKLDDNVWNMERTFELSQIFSDEELEGVEKLIEETKGKIDSQVPPPERQDIAGLEEKIFNNILRS